MGELRRRVLRLFTVVNNWFYFRSKKHKKYLQGWNDGMIDCLRKLSARGQIDAEALKDVWERNDLVDGELFPRRSWLPRGRRKIK